MRVLIDMQSCQTNSSRLRGIGRYSLSLTRALARLCHRKGHALWLLTNGLLPQPDFSLMPELEPLIQAGHAVELSLPKKGEYPCHKRVCELLREYAIGLIDPDICLITSLFEGWTCDEDAITSIGALGDFPSYAVILYDLIPFLNQATYLSDPLSKENYLQKIEFLKRADLIFTISEYVAKEATLAMPELSGRLFPISSAIDESRFRPIEFNLEEKEAILGKYGLKKPFLLFVGAAEPRKNIDGLLRAYALLPQKIRDSFCLMLVCQADESLRNHYIALASFLGISEDQIIIPAGHVPDPDLAALYNLCALFVFPSFHEGFGLPVLEAMACGAAVIGSNTTSVPEVIGCEEALFDPKNPDDIMEKIAYCLEHEEFLQKLRSHGLKRASFFSWQKTAQKALNAMSRLAASSNKAKKNYFMPSDLPSLFMEKLDGFSKDIKAFDPDFSVIKKYIAKNEDIVSKAIRRPLSWRIEGPFDSSYSLAIINRELARSLKELGHSITLRSTEGPGDFEPNPLFLKENPDIKEMFEMGRTKSNEDPQVVSRLLYPPRVKDMRAPARLLHCYAWEETGFPQKWVDDFNAHLSGISCLSEHVKKILRDNGVAAPIFVTGCGVERWGRMALDENYRIEAKAFRFLHVSSCFPRKGVDVLIRAYFRAFSGDDDVSLVIKTFPNPHNQVLELLEAAKKSVSNPPHAIIINKDISDSQLKALYHQCHCLVAPSRAEGFGLPIAEAMLLELPVIATGWGGHMDFCDEDTAWLIRYRLEYAKTHFELFDSLWAEPDEGHLATLLKKIRGMPRDELNIKTKRAKAFVKRHFSWKQAARRCSEAAKIIYRSKPYSPSPQKTAWITTWNARCGIAEYSANLIAALDEKPIVLAAYANETISPDGENVIRCWNPDGRDPLDKLRSCLGSMDIKNLVIQFNYGLFDFSALSELMLENAEKGVSIFIFLHSTTDWPDGTRSLSQLAPALSRCAILAHTAKDINRLNELGLYKNSILFPHFVSSCEPANIARPCPPSRKLLASYGFFLPHKGLLELVKALKLCLDEGMDLHLLLANAKYPLPISQKAIQEVGKAIKALGLQDRVSMFTQFLPQSHSLGLLRSADLIIFPYQHTGESSSAAARVGLSSGRPVAVTPLEIFSDLRQAVFCLPGFTALQICKGVKEILNDLLDPNIREAHMKKQRLWLESHQVQRIAKRFKALLSSFGPF